MAQRAATLWWSLAVGAAVAGLVVGLTPVEAGDSYCGTVLYDTSSVGPCSSPMAWRRVVASLCLVTVLAIVFGRALRGRRSARRERRVRLVAGALVSLSVLAALLMLNRLLQPIRAEWCGSVVNRHRTYELDIERRCDHLLEPYRAAALAAGAAAVVMLGAGVALWRRQAGLVEGARSDP